MPSSKPFKVLDTAMVLLNRTRCSALIACLNVSYCILPQGTPHGVSFYAGVIGILSVRAACMRDAVVTVHCTVCTSSVSVCLSVCLSVSLGIIIYLSEHRDCINLFFLRMQIMCLCVCRSFFLSVSLFLSPSLLLHMYLSDLCVTALIYCLFVLVCVCSIVVLICICSIARTAC